MASTGVPTITAPGIPTDLARPKPWRDLVLKGVANDGVRFLFDLAFPWSYPGGPPAGRPAAGDPAHGATVYDVAERSNGSVSRGYESSRPLPYLGGGFDMTQAYVGGATPDCGVLAPASALADIAAPFGGLAQQFLIVHWLKLPLAANWATGSGIASFAGDKSFQTNPSLASLGFSLAAVGDINIRRQTTANAAAALTVRADAEDLGTVCQVALWRNSAGIGLRLRSLTSGKAAKTATGAAGADNDQNFAANTFAFGRSSAFPGSTSGVSPLFSGVRTYRGMIENLARSGRDPLTVLDADYAAVAARNPFA